MPSHLPALPFQVMTARLATVFATLREMPAIRFRAAAPPGERGDVTWLLAGCMLDAVVRQRPPLFVCNTPHLACWFLTFWFHSSPQTPTSTGEEFPPGLESRLLVAQRIAVELHEQLTALQVGGLARPSGCGWACTLLRDIGQQSSNSTAAGTPARPATERAHVAASAHRSVLACCLSARRASSSSPTAASTR